MFKVLVVEDDKNLKKLIVTWLKKSNYITYETNYMNVKSFYEKN